MRRRVLNTLLLPVAVARPADADAGADATVQPRADREETSVSAAGPKGTEPDADTQRPHAASDEHVRGSSLLLAGRVFAFGIGFVTQVLLVRALSKGEFGAFAFALSAVALLQAFALFEMPSVVARFLPIYRERGETAKLFGAIRVAFAVTCLGGVACAAATIGAVTLAGLRPIDDPEALRLLAVMALLIPLQAIEALFTSLFAAFGSARAIVLRQSVLLPTLRLLVVLGMLAVGATMTTLALGYLAVAVVGVVVSAAMFVTLLRERGLSGEWRATPPERPLREMFGFALPLLGSTLVWTLMDSSASLFLGYFHGAEAVAAFRAVMPLGQAILLVSGTFATLYMPIAARLHARGDQAGLEAFYWRSALWMAVLAFPPFLLMCAFAGPVTVGLFGPDYAGSAPFLALLSCAFFIQTASGFNGLTLKVLGKLRHVLLIDLSAALANLLLNLLLVPRWGALGAAIATAATMILHNLLKQVALWKVAGIAPVPPTHRWLHALLFVAPPLLALHALVPGGIWVAVSLGAATVLLVAWMSRDALRLDDTFPELRRWAVTRALTTRRRPA